MDYVNRANAKTTEEGILNGGFILPRSLCRNGFEMTNDEPEPTKVA